MVSARARRQQAAYAMRRGLSQRRACRLISVARSSLHYRSRQDAKDAPVVAVMKRLAARHPRYGYRRIKVLMGRAGYPMSFDRAYRLWCRAELQVPKKRPRRRLAMQPRPHPAKRANDLWAIDFVFDRCANGQVLKCLTVVDEFTHACLSIDVAGRLRSRQVIAELSRLMSAHGAPRAIRSDHGPEFVADAVRRWLRDEGIETALIEPGKPWQNGINESFNGKFRDECLNVEWFRTRREARVLIERWRYEYNTERPHSSLGYLTPNEFINQLPKEAISTAIL